MFKGRTQALAIALTLAAVGSLTPTVLNQASAAECPADDFALWDQGQLRGANVFLGTNPEGGPKGFGDGPFSQSDIDDLRAAGANYVHISAAGLMAEREPYEIDEDAEASLDRMLDMAVEAGLWAVIAFRSGPGRNEHAITARTIGEDEDERPNPDLYERIWESEDDQDAWVDMWSHTAAKYRDHVAVIGYSVMVEPNAHARLEYMGPDEFYGEHENTLNDFNVLARRATVAIRQEDPSTPILLEPEGHGGVEWLSYLKQTGDDRTVYTVHDYQPEAYNFQKHDADPMHGYPGDYDLDEDGQEERVDRTWIEEHMQPVPAYGDRHGVPVAVTEFGVQTFLPGAAEYLADRVAVHEPIGSWAVWVWQPSNFEDPRTVHDDPDVHKVMVGGWEANRCYLGGESL